jgi:outer membrane protein OmpA-like peptidoglycan-associated protein
MKYKHLLIYFFSFIALADYAQDDEKSCQEIDNKKAVNAYKEGVNRSNKKEERLEFLKKAMQLEPDYVDANFAFAEERIKTLSIENAAYKVVEPYFLKVIEFCPKYHADPYFYVGWSYYEQDKWEECVKYLKDFLKFKSDDDKKFNKNYDDQLEKAKKMLYWAKFYNEINKNPVPFEPYALTGVSTEVDEYLPIISPDDQMVFFTRKQPHTKKLGELTQTDKEDEFFCFSKRSPETGEFDRGRRMPYPFNHGTNEGGATISVDNKHLYFTVCKNEGGEQANCDVYFSDFINGEWTKPEKVPGINDSVFWDSQPTLSADGKTLYFCSDRKGGYGGVDIYKTVKDDATGKWSIPMNAGRPINTNGDEFAPFLHSDFHSLYFSSDGHPSVGGQDIYFVHMGEDGKWSEPKNLGIPINTKGDDIGFFVSTDGRFAYFASNQPSRGKGRGVGKFDIYYFELYKEVRPDDVVLIRGKVDDNSSNGSKDFTVDIKDAVTQKKTDAVVDTSTGEYTAIVNVKNKNDLIVTVKKQGAAFSSQLISKDDVIKSSSKNDSTAAVAQNSVKSFTTAGKPVSVNTKPKQNTVIKPISADLRLDTLKVGQAYTINNIYYNTNSAELDPRSVIVIDEFATYLKANPKIKIEIHGHTDNVGNEKDNLSLSTIRASAVRDILIKMGVDQSKIVAFKGFGASKPVADNATEEGRKKNRRTEFLIVAK